MKKERVLTYYQRIYLKILERKNTWRDEQNFPGGTKYSEKTFYIIRRSGMKLGLFSLFNTNLARIVEAYQNNMIPVIDMQNFKNAYLEDDELQFFNAWEKYFEQPSEFSLKEAYRGKRVILSNANVPAKAPNDSLDFLIGKNGELQYWRKKCRKYIRLKENVEIAFNQKYQSLFRTEDRILGVLARGTDYVKLKPANHPIQPTVEQLIEKTKEVMQKYECNKIFLATEDKYIANSFFEEFGNICVTNSKDYVDYSDGYLSEIKSERENDKFIRGLDYLVTILILSKCNCIVAGRTSGTVGAALFSEGWEYSYFFDLGYYK